MELTWYGHSTWEVLIGETRLLIDPFFDNPKTDLQAGDLEVPDYLLLTHGHADHIGDVDVFADRTTIVGTPELTSYIGQEYGAEETIGMNIGGTIECDDVFVTMVQALHTNGINMDPALEVGLPAGYVLSDTHPTALPDPDAESFYHTGDTALTADLKEVIAPFLAPNVVAVPIGDHFTMGPQQAAIAVDWVGAEHAFPMHYDTFPPIEQEPEAFVRAVEELGSDTTVHLPEADEPVIIDS